MPTIKGRLVKELHEPGDLYVSCLLNQENEATQQQNQGKDQPILLRDVIRVDKSTGDAWPNAILVDEGSIIEFHIRSRGPYGFKYRLTTDNEAIVESLYQTNTDGSGHYLTSVCRRQQSDQASTLRVDSFAAKELITREDKARYWSCNIQTWKVLGYKGGNQTYGAARDSVEADVKGGALDTTGPRSSTTFGSISHVNEESAPNGYLRVFFFIFASPEAKAKFYEAYADANPDDF